MTDLISKMECLETDLTSWEIGPYHGALPGPMKMRLKLDGEIIVSGSVETGFLHRGLEKTFELHDWRSAIPYADRLDPESSAAGELALCLAVEEIAELEVPKRAQWIRVILSELTRVSAHLGYISRMARSVGADTMVHYVLRDRERVLDLFELLTGARFSVNFLRYGGVAADVTEGFIERVLEACDLLRIRLKEYNDLFSFNHAFLKRSVGIGIIGTEQVRALGITGPNARSSGLSFDVRKVHPYSSYSNFDFEIPVGQSDVGNSGDAHGRFLLRLREITQSLEILKQACDSIPAGEYKNTKLEKEFRIPPGEAYGRIESARGLLGCHVVSDGGDRPSRIHFRVPSLAHVSVIPSLIEGARLEDLPMLLASLDVGIAEVDR